jgi:hypothetical protein
MGDIPLAHECCLRALLLGVGHLHLPRAACFAGQQKLVNSPFERPGS